MTRLGMRTSGVPYKVVHPSNPVLITSSLNMMKTEIREAGQHTISLEIAHTSTRLIPPVITVLDITNTTMKRRQSDRMVRFPKATAQDRHIFHLIGAVVVQNEIMTPIPIDTSDSLAKFVDDVDALHDALLHEAVLMHPGYVDSNRQMWFETEPLNARLIFQSQAPDFSAVQLNLRGVKSLRVDTNLEFRLEVEYHN